MKKMKKVMILLCVCLSIVSLVACSGASNNQKQEESPVDKSENNEKQVFTLAMDAAEDTVTYLLGEKFKTILEEKLDGKVTVQLFPNAQLGGDQEIAESCQAGEIDFVVQNSAPQVGFIPELAIFDLPNVFPDKENARATLNGPFYSKLSGLYENNGFKLLGFSDQGYRIMSSNKKVVGIEDFKGIKIRTMQNPNHIEYWKSLGANPTPMAFSEVYIGLQQGTIVAQENPYEEIVASKFYEQQKYAINTNHIYHNIVFMGSLKKYNELSAEYKDAITTAAKEASEWACKQADLREEDRIKIMKDNGMEIVDLDAAVIEQMAEKAKSVYNTIRSKVGNDLFDSLLSAVKEAK